MPYTTDATVVTEPSDNQKASVLGAEMRAVKAYIKLVILAALNAKLSKTGDAISGTLVSTANEALRINEEAAFISGYSGLVRTGYLQFLAGNVVALVAENAVNGIYLAANGHAIGFNGNTLLTSTLRNLGTVASRWGTCYIVNGDFSGVVRANSFIGDASQLTNLPAGSPPNNAQVLAGLGYTPYNASNPNGYISSITGGQVVAAIGYTPYSNSNPSGYMSSISGALVNAALGYTAASAVNPNANSQGNKFISTAEPSGIPAGGDIWYKYTP